MYEFHHLVRVKFWFIFDTFRQQFVRQNTNFITWQESCFHAIISIDGLNFERQYTYFISCRESRF